MLLLSLPSQRASQARNPHQPQPSPGIQSLRLSKASFYSLDLCADATDPVCHQPGLLGTDPHATVRGDFVKALN